MSLADIKKVEATSKAKNGPWKTFWEEMARKTIVKRASKYWPKVDRLDKAIDYLNNDMSEGIETEPLYPHHSEKEVNQQKAVDFEALCKFVEECEFKMNNAQSMNELKAAFQDAYKATVNTDKGLHQSCQAVYAQNKARLENVIEGEKA